MEVVFLSAKKKLSKEITADGTKPYPLIKNFTSSHFDITPDKKGLNKLYKLLTEQAEAGACLHKGGLKQPLQDEPRAFMSDRTAPTELLVLDIDGLRTVPGEDLQAMADKIVLQLPEVFHNVSYSASKRILRCKEGTGVYASVLSYGHARTSEDSKGLPTHA